MLSPENKATHSILIKTNTQKLKPKQTKKTTKAKIKFKNQLKIYILCYSRHL